MKRTIALLLCVGLLLGGCGSFQAYVQGVPINAPAREAQGMSGETVLAIAGVVAAAVLIGFVVSG